MKPLNKTQSRQIRWLAACSRSSVSQPGLDSVKMHSCTPDWIWTKSREESEGGESVLHFSLLSSSLSTFCRWHGVDSMWFNCQPTVMSDTAPERAKMHHRAMHSFYTHTNTHTPLQICQGQSLPLNFNILLVTIDSSTLALCPQLI